MPVPFVNKNENTYKSQKELTNNHFHINVNESPIVEPINQTNRGKNVQIVCLSVSNRKQNVFTNLDILNWIFFSFACNTTANSSKWFLSFNAVDSL